MLSNFAGSILRVAQEILDQSEHNGSKLLLNFYKCVQIMYCVCFNLYCGYFNLFCNVWVCVCVGVLEVCILVLSVFSIVRTVSFILFLLCIFILICFVSTNVRTTVTE